MKLQFAVIALSATLVACGGGSSGDSDLDETGPPFIGGGDDIDNEDGDDFTDSEDTFADGCEGGAGTDLDSSTAEWNDNCRLQVGGEHQISSYTQGVQRIIFCRGHNQDLSTLEINNFADGDFGPITQEEVRNFQTAEGIVVDGIVGPETWAALQAVIEFNRVNTVDGSDGYSVTPGVCDVDLLQFFQVVDGVAEGSWTMATTPGVLEAVPFSVGPPN